MSAPYRDDVSGAAEDAKGKFIAMRGGALIG
jgi:hypothetical protein